MVLKRRDFIRLSAGLAGGAVLLAACTPKTPTAAPTSAPAQPKATEAKATTAPTAVPPTQPPAAKAQDKVALRVGAWEFADRPWMAQAPKEYAEKHPEVSVEVEIIVYAEAFTKALTGVATGTLPDVLYAPCRWANYAAYKGAFLYLDDLIQTKDPGMDDWFGSVKESAMFEGRMYALPHELHPGRPTAVYFNKDLLAKRGVAEPTDDWTMDQFAEMASKVTDRPNKIFGSNFLPTNVHDFICMARSMGGDLMDPERKKCVLTTNEGALAAARWQVDMKTKWDAVPGREEREGIEFYAGLYGYQPNAANIIKTVEVGVGDKFKWDVVLAPTGPKGLRGAYAFINSLCLSAKTAHPAEAYDMAIYMTSEDVMRRALLEQGHNPARKSLWIRPEANPIWKKTHDWLETSTVPWPWPAPWNLLFEELQDRWSNLTPELWYGEIGFEEGLQKVQDECQKVLDKPRP